MPLAGTDPILAQSIVSITSSVAAGMGYTPEQIATLTASLQPLASGIAQAVIAHIIAFAQVTPGIVVATSGGAGATTTPGVIA